MPEATVYLCDWQQGKRPCHKQVLEEEGASFTLSLALPPEKGEDGNIGDAQTIQASGVFCGRSHAKAFLRWFVGQDFDASELATAPEEEEEEEAETE